EGTRTQQDGRRDCHQHLDQRDHCATLLSWFSVKCPTSIGCDMSTAIYDCHDSRSVKTELLDDSSGQYICIGFYKVVTALNVDRGVRDCRVVIGVGRLVQRCLSGR